MIKFLVWDKKEKCTKKVLGINYLRSSENIEQIDAPASICLWNGHFARNYSACHYILMPYLGWDDMEGNPVHQGHIVESEGVRHELKKDCMCSFKFDKTKAKIVGVIYED